MDMNVAKLAELLREAEKAHKEVEATVGHSLDDWPTFYAHFIVAKLWLDYGIDVGGRP